LSSLSELWSVTGSGTTKLVVRVNNQTVQLESSVVMNFLISTFRLNRIRAIQMVGVCEGRLPAVFDDFTK